MGRSGVKPVRGVEDWVERPHRERVEADRAVREPEPIRVDAQDFEATNWPRNVLGNCYDRSAVDRGRRAHRARERPHADSSRWVR